MARRVQIAEQRTPPMSSTMWVWRSRYIVGILCKTRRPPVWSDRCFASAMAFSSASTCSQCGDDTSSVHSADLLQQNDEQFIGSAAQRPSGPSSKIEFALRCVRCNWLSRLCSSSSKTSGGVGSCNSSSNSSDEAHALSVEAYAVCSSVWYQLMTHQLLDFRWHDTMHDIIQNFCFIWLAIFPHPGVPVKAKK